MTTHFLVGRSGVEQEVFGRRVRERAVLHALAERVIHAVGVALAAGRATGRGASVGSEEHQLVDRGRDQVAVQFAGNGAAGVGVEVELAEDMYGSPVAFRAARRADEMSRQRGVRGDRLVFGRRAEVQVELSSRSWANDSLLALIRMSAILMSPRADAAAPMIRAQRSLEYAAV